MKITIQEEKNSHFTFHRGKKGRSRVTKIPFTTLYSVLENFISCLFRKLSCRKNISTLFTAFGNVVKHSLLSLMQKIKIACEVKLQVTWRGSSHANRILQTRIFSLVGYSSITSVLLFWWNILGFWIKQWCKDNRHTFFGKICEEEKLTSRVNQV